MANLVYLAECFNTENLKKRAKISFTLNGGGITLYGRVLSCTADTLQIKVKGRKPYIFNPSQLQENNITLLEDVE